MPWDHLLQEELSNGSNYFLATNYPIHSINYLGITRQNTNLLINSTRIPKKWLWVVSRFGLKKSCHLPSIPLYVVQSSQSAGSSMNALKVKIACRSQLTMAVCANFLPKFLIWIIKWWNSSGVGGFQIGLYCLIINWSNSYCRSAHLHGLRSCWL